MRRFWRPVAFGLLAVLAVACLRELRRVTYPPDFRYLEQRELGEAMRRMTRALRALDDLLGHTPERPPAAPERVAALLEEIERSARGLAAESRPTNHPMLGDRMEIFLRDLEAAQRAVRGSPPSYFLAGSVVGSCRYCHGGR